MTPLRLPLRHEWVRLRSAALRTHSAYALGSACLFPCSWLDLLDGTAATRKPRLTRRLSGTSLLRLAARQYLASLHQPPPRNTRCVALVSAHHSHTFPAMSMTPNGERSRGKIPTADVLPSPASLLLQIPSFQSLPHGYSEPFGPRAAASASSALGSRTPAHLQKSLRINSADTRS